MRIEKNQSISQSLVSLQGKFVEETLDCLRDKEQDPDNSELLEYAFKPTILDPDNVWSFSHGLGMKACTFTKPWDHVAFTCDLPDRNYQTKIQLRAKVDGDKNFFYDTVEQAAFTPKRYADIITKALILLNTDFRKAIASCFIRRFTSVEDDVAQILEEVREQFQELVFVHPLFSNSVPPRTRFKDLEEKLNSWFASMTDYLQLVISDTTLNEKKES